MRRSNDSFDDLSDSELVRAARAQPAAFEELFERHALPLRQWLFAQTGDRAAAQDLLAETFAQAWLGIGRFRGRHDDSGGAWLYGIARNLLRQHRARGRVANAGRTRLGLATASSDGGEIDEVAARLDARELAPAVRAAFAELTAEQQHAIGYRVIDELSYQEVAARLDCSTATARTRVFRGLQTLRGAVLKGAQP
jgi:RNA polymerase sigma factor (sigma-70 family)